MMRKVLNILKKSNLLSFLLFLQFISYARGEVIARLVKYEGRVYFKRLGMNTFAEQAKIGSAIRNGDEMKVDNKSFAAVIYIDDRSILKIRENTKFSFMDTRNSRTIDIKHGTILNDIKKEKRKKDYRIQTSVSVASVKGTEFAAIVNMDGVDQFICKEGSFEVLNMISGETINIQTGQKAVSNSIGNLVQAPASPGEYPPDPEIDDKIIEPRAEPISQKESQSIELKSEGNDKEQPIDENTQVDANETKINESVQKEGLDNNKNNEAEEPKPTETPRKPFSMGLGIGSATLDGVIYNQIALRPEIYIAKIGIGLDLAVYMDNDGNIRKDEWDIDNDPSLLLDKILYVRYAERTDPIWIKYGSIESLTLGYGGIMNNYSNMMQYPSVRRVGVGTGFNYKQVSGELFLSNLKDISRGGTVTGLRIQYTISDEIPISLGFNYITDGNMFSSLKDKDNDTYPDVFDDFPDDSTIWNDTDGDGWPDPGQGTGVPDSLIDIDADGDNITDSQESNADIELKSTPFSLKDNKAKTTGFSFDVGYPILESNVISITLFAEYNKLNFQSAISSDSSFVRKERSGTGITIPGLRSKILSFLNLSLEYRTINNAYLPQFFDQAYDINRIVTSSSNNQTIVRTKDMIIFESMSDSSKSSGLFGSAGFNLFDLADFTVSYANMKADTSEIKSFSSFLTLNTDIIPKISLATAYYQRNNDDNPFDFDNPTENTIMGYTIGYELSKGVSLIMDFKQSYRNDGTGNLEAIKQTNIETSFSF